MKYFWKILMKELIKCLLLIWLSGILKNRKCTVEAEEKELQEFLGSDLKLSSNTCNHFTLYETNTMTNTRADFPLKKEEEHTNTMDCNTYIMYNMYDQRYGEKQKFELTEGNIAGGNVHNIEMRDKDKQENSASYKMFLSLEEYLKNCENLQYNQQMRDSSCLSTEDVAKQLKAKKTINGILQKNDNIEATFFSNSDDKTYQKQTDEESQMETNEIEKEYCNKKNISCYTEEGEVLCNDESELCYSADDKIKESELSEMSEFSEKSEKSDDSEESEESDESDTYKNCLTEENSNSEIDNLFCMVLNDTLDSKNDIILADDIYTDAKASMDCPCQSPNRESVKRIKTEEVMYEDTNEFRKEYEYKSDSTSFGSTMKLRASSAKSTCQKRMETSTSDKTLAHSDSCNLEKMKTTKKNEDVDFLEGWRIEEYKLFQDAFLQLSSDLNLINDTNNFHFIKRISHIFATMKKKRRIYTTRSYGTSRNCLKQLVHFLNCHKESFLRLEDCKDCYQCLEVVEFSIIYIFLLFFTEQTDSYLKKKKQFNKCKKRNMYFKNWDSFKNLIALYNRSPSRFKLQLQLENLSDSAIFSAEIQTLLFFRVKRSKLKDNQNIKEHRRDVQQLLKTCSIILSRLSGMMELQKPNTLYYVPMAYANTWNRLQKILNDITAVINSHKKYILDLFQLEYKDDITFINTMYTQLGVTLIKYVFVDAENIYNMREIADLTTSLKLFIKIKEHFEVLVGASDLMYMAEMSRMTNKRKNVTPTEKEKKNETREETEKEETEKKEYEKEESEKEETEQEESEKEEFEKEETEQEEIETEEYEQKEIENEEFEKEKADKEKTEKEEETKVNAIYHNNMCLYLISSFLQLKIFEVLTGEFKKMIASTLILFWGVEENSRLLRIKHMQNTYAVILKGRKLIKLLIEFASMLNNTEKYIKHCHKAYVIYKKLQKKTSMFIEILDGMSLNERINIANGTKHKANSLFLEIKQLLKEEYSLLENILP